MTDDFSRFENGKTVTQLEELRNLGLGLSWSPQQEATFQWVRQGKGSATLEAVAGSGKTTTVVEAARYMTGRSITFVAYNKKIAVEIGVKLKANGSKALAMTMHSAGFSAWRKVAPKVVVNEHKVDDLIEKMKIPEGYFSFVKKLVSLCKQNGWCIGAEPIRDHAPWEDAMNHHDVADELTAAEDATTGIEYAMDVLEQSLKQDREIIDFDDMIHAPLYHGAPFWQNDWLIIDEAQDTNRTRRLLARAMLKPNGRLLAVGDRHQAIYGFTGADSDALDLISEQFGCVQLPLTVSYRCPKAVVAHAQKWVHHIESAPNAIDGTLRALSYEEFGKLSKEAVTKDDAVICRYTKPLVTEAYNFIRRGIGCHVEGREIGKGLVALTNKWVVRTSGALRRKLEEWEPAERTRLLVKKQEQRADALTDKVETLFVIMDQLPDDAPIAELRSSITKLFGDTEPGTPSPNLTLCTVHKAKGREWDRVYLLGRGEYMPSKYATQQWQLGQENNLIYVAITRAKRELVEVQAAPRG